MAELQNAQDMSLATMSDRSPDRGAFGGSDTTPPNLVPLVEIYPRCLSDSAPIHAEWVFGAIAELIDNANDANASKLLIAFKRHPLAKPEQEKCVRSFAITDNGTGMSHEELLGMLTFGPKTCGPKDLKRIGMFGAGFQSGCMALGTDALVITSTKATTSVALLSRSFNRTNENLEVLIATYIKGGLFCEPDLKAQSKEIAEHHMKAIASFSPFCEMTIGEEMGEFRDRTGTSIFVWDPEEVDSKSVLEYTDNDILIRRRRVRKRQGICGNQVPLDYSLRAYLEIFSLSPSLEIHLMNSPVIWNDWEQKLSSRECKNFRIKNTRVALTLGVSQQEKGRENRGLFIYWRGRLIVAYKRVGNLIHSVKMGDGIVGFVNLTNIEDADEDLFWLKLTKQEFRDSEAYDGLKRWLGAETDRYWDRYVDPIKVKDVVVDPETREGSIQCNRCQKWRKPAPISPTDLVWFCEYGPYFGKCDDPEEEVDASVVTISIQRSVDPAMAIEWPSH